MVDVQHCFPPIICASTRLLVLGSLPGAASLTAGRYYAHPRNQFWRLLELVLEQPLASLAYPARLELLLGRGIGLWDTIASGQRPGSLDANIRLAEASDVAQLAATLPSLQAIAFNGDTAARIGRRELPVAPSFTLIDLPSSSPAYTLPFAAKTEAWLQLRSFIRAAN